MLIRVLHNEGYYDYVKPQVLDRLIESGQIISFYRQTGPVVLGVNSIRSSQSCEYRGPERRLTA